MSGAGRGDTASAWDAVRISPEDSVAVALRPLQGTARVRLGDQVVEWTLRDPIPMGHKFALLDLPAGAEIRKYGEIIGTATAPIASGAHVHVHNLVSRRAASPLQ